MKDFVNYVSLAWLALMILKALDYLTWSWLATLFFPVWFPVGITLACIVCILAIVIVTIVLLLILGCCGVFRDTKNKLNKDK